MPEFADSSKRKRKQCRLTPEGFQVLDAAIARLPTGDQTLDALAARSGCDRGTVSKIRTGKNPATLSKIEALFDSLDLELQTEHWETCQSATSVQTFGQSNQRISKLETSNLILNFGDQATLPGKAHQSTHDASRTASPISVPYFYPRDFEAGTFAERSRFATIHLSLGGQHQGWGGTDKITLNLQNEGFHPVQLIRCSVHWKTVDGITKYELKPDAQIRWLQPAPRQDGYDNFALPKMLKSGYIIQAVFKLTPQDIHDSGIDISKYVAAIGNEWMASSIIYEAFSEIKTETGHRMSRSIVYSFERDRDKTLRILLE